MRAEDMEEDLGPKIPLTDEERAWLASVEAEWSRTTSGPWYAHHTDDALFMSATYVSTDAVPGSRRVGFLVDEGTGLAVGSPDQADHEKVVAITLLQEPRLADPEESDANTLFIANVHQHVPRLLALIQRLIEIATTRSD